MITAVIVAYRTAPADLIACCRSLRENNADSIIIVDNSPAGTLGGIAAQFRARYLPLAMNSGFAAAANRGAHAAVRQKKPSADDLLLFLNPDAALSPGALNAARNALRRWPQAAIAGLALHDEAGRLERRSLGPAVTPLTLLTRHIKNITWPGVTRLASPRRARSFLSKHATGVSRGRDSGNVVCTAGWVSGGAMLVRTGVFRRLGGFDEQFFLYWEDVDLCRRAYAAGYSVIYVPAARVHHRRGASSTDTVQKTRWYDESADKYFRKQYAKPTWYTVRIARRLYRHWQRHVV
ncbi:MAG: hypothetical protein COT71_00835 [Candidatus Andersenbacteria bacterium CG10_big_fil_rev_8_21_14_0_10_54_11]|uniref:Glycosyltransferase 2-like domain-containing protein n=1 Tax=Candidatus Andersenbacteria bacterium CG10_big_fil_rev_8_21_14_0_10_54_11 TaxID=1974485 RepID=A0A2M6X0A4_9BACT|nr:MAG: hypothetical protein COT71_00835 [Candidatus Andersenbacteria bacterium CG10_big_fil_rev_8_21_14_0_10_54_11]